MMSAPTAGLGVTRSSGAVVLHVVMRLPVVSATSSVPAIKSMPRTEGWNQIGMGLVPQVSDTSSVLASIAGQYDLVYA